MAFRATSIASRPSQTTGTSHSSVEFLPRSGRTGRSPSRSALGLKLKIAAKVDAVDHAYFAETIAPLLVDASVEFVGEINDDEKTQFLGNAAALLFPIDWPEPFGLVMIEAMACGTPVVAWRCGAVPEIVDEGVTGFVVSSEEEAAAAVVRARTLDRGVIRGMFERRFTASAMARHYVEVYRYLSNVWERGAPIAAVA